MPGTQPVYTQLPDGRWIQVPTDAAGLARLKSWLDTHSEKASVENRPDANAQAKASIKTDLAPVSKLTGQAIPKTNDSDKSAGTGTMNAVKSFNQGATGGASSVPEFFHGINELRKEGPISAVTDIVQGMSDATTDAMKKYGEKDPKRYLAAVPFVGPTLAANEEKPFVEGLAGDIGLATGGAIFSKFADVFPEATANTVKATNQAYEKIFSDPKLSMRQATSEAANMLSTREISPADYGRELQNTFDQVKNKAGQEKGEFIASVMRESPDLRVSPRNVNGVLQQEVKNLQFMKERNPELFKEGTAAERTLSILERELRNTQDYNLTMADTRRSQFWNYKQQLDPSMASRIIGDLDRATTQDITNALAGKDPKLAEQYLQKSARYKELNDVGRADVLRQVFGNNRASPDRVMEFLNKAPEESIKAIQTLQRENPQALADMRRQLFEQSMKTAGAKGLMKLQPSLVRAIYGPQAEAVTQFIDLINKKAAVPDSIVTKVPGLKGAGFRIDLGKSKPAITIRASEMAKILRSSEIMRLFTQAAEMPASAPQSALMQDTLKRAIDSLGIRDEAAQKTSRVPLWKREGGGGGENPPGGTPAPNEPTPPAQGGPGGAHFEAGTGYRPSEKAETLSGKPKEYGKEFDSQEWQEEIRRNEQILRDPRATAEDRSIATDRLRDAKEGFQRVQSGGKNVPEAPNYKIEEKGGTKWAVTPDGVRVSITDRMTPEQIEKSISDQIEMRKKFTADRAREKEFDF